MSEHAEEKDFGRNPQATETRTFMEYVGGARYEIDSRFLPDIDAVMTNQQPAEPKSILWTGKKRRSTESEDKHRSENGETIPVGRQQLRYELP